MIHTRATIPSPVEKSLDLQLKEWIKRKDLLVKAVKYKRTNEVDRINALINKWRKACQDASNYLLNEMQIKIMNSGGYSAWKKNQKDKKINRSFEDECYKEKLSDFVNSEEFSHLSTYEQSDIMDQLNRSDQSVLEFEKDDSDAVQITMHEFYNILKLDYELVYNFQQE